MREEVASLNRIVSAYLDVAEDMALRRIPMTTYDWSDRLDIFLRATDREVLEGTGTITAEIAKEHAEAEYEKYRIVQDRSFVSDYDKFIEQLLATSEKKDDE
ncbi:MAG: virulence RhuM family protein [Methanomassiliicoccaceae archaeon]|nr:virulence RhuM family protein [Methanomassiliicoccaceae archaeon]